MTFDLTFNITFYVLYRVNRMFGSQAANSHSIAKYIGVKKFSDAVFLNAYLKLEKM